VENPFNTKVNNKRKKKKIRRKNKNEDEGKREEEDRPCCPWLRRSVTGFSLRSAGFDHGPVRVMFLVDKLALVRGLLRALRLSSVGVIRSMLRTQLLVCYRCCVMLTNEHTNKYPRSIHCIHLYSRNNIRMYILM
jgi:hypothetical protein